MHHLFPCTVDTEREEHMASYAYADHKDQYVSSSSTLVPCNALNEVNQLLFGHSQLSWDVLLWYCVLLANLSDQDTDSAKQSSSNLFEFT